MYSLVVVGAGGTGTYFLKEFSRFIHKSNMKDGLFTKMVIFDGDVVEGKNLTRQCFMEEDIGRNKAAVMAEILNDAFELEFEAHGVYLSSIKQLQDVVEDVALIVSCVDNHACRLLLEEYFDKADTCVYYDAANEFDTGEVVYAYKKNHKVIGQVRSHYFPNIKKEKTKSREELSCEELNNVSPQHIFTNMYAANLLCSGIANLLQNKKTPGFSYFNALTYECHFIPYKENGK